MTIVFAALHQTLRYRGEDTGLYGAAFDDGRTFFSRRQPPLYDADAQPMSPREVPPGSRARVLYHEQNGRQVMDAVQIVRLAQDASPFDPFHED